MLKNSSNKIKLKKIFDQLTNEFPATSFWGKRESVSDMTAPAELSFFEKALDLFKWETKPGLWEFDKFLKIGHLIEN